MFPLARRALMVGSHTRQENPIPGHIYAFTIDVAGQDETVVDDSTQLSNPRRDSTVLTIFELELPKDSDLASKPIYNVVNRLVWIGVKHSLLYSTIVGLNTLWSPVKVIIDATGVGAGLSGFLVDKIGTKVLPFEFSQISKSDLGWSFLATVETGRYREYFPFDSLMNKQLEYCQYQIKDGPGKLMKWGVPDGTRDVSDGDLVHDDLVISSALISLLDDETWGTGDSQVIQVRDILEELKFS
jgi:hypothetical protein